MIKKERRKVPVPKIGIQTMVLYYTRVALCVKAAKQIFSRYGNSRCGLFLPFLMRKTSTNKQKKVYKQFYSVCVKGKGLKCRLLVL